MILNSVDCVNNNATRFRRRTENKEMARLYQYQQESPSIVIRIVRSREKNSALYTKVLHLSAWKHRMNGDKEAMHECHKLAVTALRQSRTYDHILKIILN